MSTPLGNAAAAQPSAPPGKGGAYLFLLRELVRRDFQGRYAGSALGFAWSFVQPAWQLLLFSFVFSGVLNVRPSGEATDRFWVFLFCGLLPWLAVHEAIQRGATAVTDNANLVKKLRFPPEILVASTALGALLHEGIAAGVFLVVLGAFGELAPLGLPWLFLAVPLQMALMLGCGLLLASVNVIFRDTAQILGMVLAAWFYLTPIVYPIALVPPALRPLVDLNPMTGIVGLYRAALLGGGPPPLHSLAALAASAGLALAVGAWVFRRLAPGFVDEI